MAALWVSRAVPSTDSQTHTQPTDQRSTRPVPPIPLNEERGVQLIILNGQRDLVELLERTGEVERHELGEHELLTLPSINVRGAIADWSDREERRWRAMTGDTTVSEDVIG